MNVYFGIGALVFTGLSWTSIGIMMSGASRRHLLPHYLQFFNSLLSVVISLAVGLGMLLLKDTPMIPPSNAGKLLLLCPFFSGVLNFYLLQLMAYGMARGPNNVVWGIIQSGVLLPCIMGIVFFNVPMPMLRLVGIVLMLCALGLFSLGKKSTTSATKSNSKFPMWLVAAFAGFLFCGVQQSINNLPSYFEASKELTGVVRAGLNSLGILLMAFVQNIYDGLKTGKMVEKEQVCNRWLWIYVMMNQGLAVITAYFLLYQGMDALAAANCGALAYPLLVTSCILGFFIYSMAVLRERNSLAQYIGFACCVAGIILASIQ